MIIILNQNNETVLGGHAMKEEYKIKAALIRTFCSLILCFSLILLKFVFKEEKIVAEVYNYLASDIVFLK